MPASIEGRLVLPLSALGGDGVRVPFDLGHQPVDVTVSVIGCIRFDEQLLKLFVEVAVEHAVVQPAEVLYLFAPADDVA